MASRINSIRIIKKTKSRRASSVNLTDSGRGNQQANAPQTSQPENFPFLDRSFSVIEHENLNRLNFQQKYQTFQNSHYADAESVLLEETTEQTTTMTEYQALPRNIEK